MTQLAAAIPCLAAVAASLLVLSSHALAFSNNPCEGGGGGGQREGAMPKNPFRRSRCSPPAHAATSATTHTARKMISEQQLGFFEVLETETPVSERRVALLDYTSCRENDDENGEPLRIDFQTAWDCQKKLLDGHIERIVSDPLASSFLQEETDTNDDDDDDDDDNHSENGHRGDAIIMLQHHPVYTLGTGSDEKFVKSSSSSSGLDSEVPVIRMDRGGEVTYHGPGQITVYPVLDLRSYKQDIHWYMRALEEAVILAISRCGGGSSEHDTDGDGNGNPGLIAEREDGVTGVWIDNHKVAAVGIKCRRWITQHGLAVNVEASSLSNFGGIVPCGLEGRSVGCLNQFLIERGREPTTVQAFAGLMAEALEEIFRIDLVDQRPLPPLN